MGIEWSFIETPEYLPGPRFRRRSCGIREENKAGHTTVQILEEIQKMLAGANVQPSQLRGWGIWLSMRNDSTGHRKHSEESCKQSETRLASCAKDFEPGRWSLLGPGDEEKLYASSIYKPEEKWNATADIMKQDFASSGYPVSKCASPLSRGVPLSTGDGRLTIHCNADPSSADMLLKTSVAVNQLRIYTAVATRRSTEKHG